MNSIPKPFAKIICMLGLACLPGSGARVAAHGGEPVQIENVLVSLIEHVELPAKEAGPLAEVFVHEGDIVEQGQALAAVDDGEARILCIKAERELAIAKKKAENDVAIRFARKAYEVANAEYRRALESVEKFKKSVSETELDQLRLAAEKALLAIEQAEQEQEIARLTQRQKETELDSARLKVQRHRVVAPFAGMIVQVNKQRGEWLSPSDAVLRLVRLDRLRVEAFVPAREYSAQMQGQRIAILADITGKGRARLDGVVTFVSPEVNPVNGQVRLWAEVENMDLLLRPGQAATLVIPSDAAPRGAIVPRMKR